jgi:hypothetical protein
MLGCSSGVVIAFPSDFVTMTSVAPIMPELQA